MKLKEVSINRIKNVEASYSVTVDPKGDGRDQTFTLFAEELPYEFIPCLNSLKTEAIRRLGTVGCWDKDVLALKKILFSERVDKGVSFALALEYKGSHYLGKASINTPGVWILPDEGSGYRAATTATEYNAVLKLRDLAQIFMERSMKGLAAV